MSSGAGMRSVQLLAAAGVLGVALIGGVLWLGSGSGESDAPSSGDALLRHVDEIRAAELTLIDVFGEPTACLDREQALALLGPAPREWESAPCWVSIGWQPEGPVRGAYWVEVTGEEFTVHGVAPDGQGGLVEVVATAAQPAAPVP